MSRIGFNPISIPEGVTVNIKGSNIKYIDTKQFMCGFYSLRKILKIS